MRGPGRCSGCAGWSRGIGTEELLRASAFSWLLGAAEGSGGADPAAARWAVWGRGDFSDFAGRPEGMSYDGKARSGWLGVDARRGRWVAGLALSHGVSEADYSYEGGAAGGRLETTLTAFYPYGRWTLAEGLEVRGVLGAGSGEARHMPEDAEAATSDLTMRMGSAGVRRELAEVLGIELAARADASLVRMEIGAGPEFIGGVSADSWRARVGLEGKRRLALGEETALTPFMEVAGRRDGGGGRSLDAVRGGGGVGEPAAAGWDAFRRVAGGPRDGAVGRAPRGRQRRGRARCVARPQAAVLRGRRGRRPARVQLFLAWCPPHGATAGRPYKASWMSDQR
ncbi:MAG: autotransporter outer membrane beta-barrel domain-containing protein [Deltaproteobacteria bacterium]|nr:autotransporter outer membrane beta-barrel domain-containing protein [Deltaproteobacteria bacterium]